MVAGPGGHSQRLYSLRLERVEAERLGVGDRAQELSCHSVRSLARTDD